MTQPKFLLLCFLFLAAPASLFATTWINEFPIYVDGDVGSIVHVFDAIRRVLKDAMVQDSILPMAILIGLWSSTKSFMSGSKVHFFATIAVLVVGSISLVYDSNGDNATGGVTVHIKDQRFYDGNQIVRSDVNISHYGTVDNVPYVLAMPISVSSVVFYNLSTLIDDAFSGVGTDGIGTTSIGFMGGTNVIMNALRMASFDRSDTTRAYRDAIKRYTSECVMAIAVNNNYSLMNKLTTPSNSLLDSLKWFNDNSFTADDTMDDGTPCTDFYTNNIANQTSNAKNELLAELNKLSKPIDLSNSTLQSALTTSYLASVESNASASSNKFLNFLAEGPVVSAVLTGIKSQELGADLAGQDAAIGSAITKTMANVQYEGVGQWRWLIEIFPFYVHFMRAVVYAVGMLVLFVIVALGYENGFPIYKNYIKGLITFEATVLSLTLVNALINEYSSVDAANQLFGGNPLTLARNGDYLNYVAKMEGVAGIIGLFAVLTIPAMIFRGEIGAAMSGLSSLAGQYRGNAAQGLQDDSAKSSSSRRVIDEASPEFIKKLKENGVSAPNGVSDLALAGKLMSEMNNSAKQLADLSSGNQLSEVGQTSYATSKAQIEGGIATGQGKIDSGEIRADGTMSVDAKSELKQQSLESSLNNMTKGHALNANFDSNEQSAKSMLFADQAKQLRAEANNLENSDAYSKATDKQKKEYDRQANTMRERASELDKASEDAMKLDSFNPLSSNNRASASQVMAIKNTAQQVAEAKGVEDSGIIGSGGEVKDGHNQFHDFLKGSESKSAQSVSEIVGVGKNIDIDKAMQVSRDDGAVSANTTNGIYDRRENLKKTDNPDIQWDAERIGLGNAINKVHGETKAQGTLNSLEKNNGDIDEAFIKSSFGNEEKGREAENAALGIGNKWGKMSDAEKIKTMNKVQENAEAGTFSDIEGKNAGIHKHSRKGKSDVDNYIEDAITTSQESELSKAKHSENMRETFGHDLKGAHKIFSEKEIKKAENEAKEAKEELGSAKTPEEKSIAQKKLDAANFVLDNKDKVASLNNTTSTVDQAKIDSNIGNALGIVENKNKGVSYAQNAMYSEESKQQGVQAKLKAQGGVDAAVSTDVAAETMKATRQQAGTTGELSTFLQSPQGGGMSKKDADDMAQSIVSGSKQGGQEIAKAMMAAAAVAGTTMKAESAVKATSSMATVDAQKKAKILDEDGDVTKEGKEALSIKPGQDAESMMGKKKLGDKSQDIVDKMYDEAYKKEFEKTKDTKKAAQTAHDTVKPYLDNNGDALQGQDFWNKQASLQAGVFMGHNSMLLGDGQIFSGAMTPDGGITGTLSSGVSGVENNSHNYNSGTMVTSGRKETTWNNVKEFLNSTPIATIADTMFDGDKEKAANFVKKFDAAKFGLSPTNQAALATATLAEGLEQATGMSPEAALILAGTGGGGIAGLTKLNKKKGPIQFSQKELDNFEAVKGDDGEISKYVDSKGRQVADKEGFSTNTEGERIKAGKVSQVAGKTLRATKNFVSGLFGNSNNFEEPHEDSKKSGNPDDNQKENGGSSNSKQQQGTPPSSDTEIVSKKSPSSKDIQTEIENTKGMSNTQAGRNKLKVLVNDALSNVEHGSEKENALRKVKAALNGQGDVSKGLMEASGFDSKALSEQGINFSVNERGQNVVDFESVGEDAKTDQIRNLEGEQKKAEMRENALESAKNKMTNPIKPNYETSFTKQFKNQFQGDGISGRYSEEPATSSSSTTSNMGPQSGNGKSVLASIDDKIGRAMDLGGKVFAGADAVLSGIRANDEYNNGNYFYSATNSLESATAAAFVVAPSPATASAYGASVLLNMGSFAMHDLATRDWSPNNFSSAYDGSNPLGAGVDPYPRNVQKMSTKQMEQYNSMISLLNR